jgi:Fe-S cluster biosynthesis and repair protein YggX
LNAIALSFAPGGGYYDVLNPLARPIDFSDIASRLARTIRFNGTTGALSIAEHATIGAEAIIAEGGSAFDAALFLHHDDHEFILGDQTSPVTDAMEAMLPGSRAQWSMLKANWDRAIYGRLGLPSPDVWTQVQTMLIRQMDLRMNVVEARVLYGAKAVAHYSAIARKTPRFNTSLAPPWPAALAEERYLAMHKKLTGKTIR